MRTRLAALGAGTALAFTTIACGGNSENNPNPPRLPGIEEATPTTVQAEDANPTTTTSLPETFDAVEAGPMTIRVIGVSQPNSSAAATAELHDQLARSPEIAAQFAADSTDEKLQLEFLEPEYVVLDEDPTPQLCNPKLPGALAWLHELAEVHDVITDTADAADDAIQEAKAADTTLYAYDFDICRIDRDGDREREVLAQAIPDNNTIDMFPGSVLPMLVVHEVGHLFGLADGDGASCPPGDVVVADFAACEQVSHGAAAVMGNNPRVRRDVFTGYESLRLNTITADSLVDVTQSGVFDLAALQNPEGPAKVLRVKATGNWLQTTENPKEEQEYYYIYLAGEWPYYGQGAENDDAFLFDIATIRTQHPALHVLRGPDITETLSDSPRTLMFDLGGSHGQGAGYDRVDGVPEFTDPETGVTITLRDIVYQDNTSTRGTGRVEITLGN
jgi:hypothetical protein